MRQARSDALLDDAALEFGKHAQHLKHRFPGRCPGVEALLIQEEIDASAISVRRAFARTPERSAVPLGASTNSDITAFDRISEGVRAGRVHDWHDHTRHEPRKQNRSAPKDYRFKFVSASLIFSASSGVSIS